MCRTEDIKRLKGRCMRCESEYELVKCVLWIRKEGKAEGSKTLFWDDTYFQRERADIKTFQQNCRICRSHFDKTNSSQRIFPTPKMYSIHNTLASSHAPTLVSCAAITHKTNKYRTYPYQVQFPKNAFANAIHPSIPFPAINRVSRPHYHSLSCQADRPSRSSE